MQRNDPAAIWASPFFFFFPQVFFHPHSLCADSILDQADVVTLPVAFVDFFDENAGEILAAEAKLHPATLGTGFDFAPPAVGGLLRRIGVAACARILFADVGIAGGTSQPAGSQHGRRDDRHFHGSSLDHRMPQYRLHLIRRGFARVAEINFVVLAANRSDSVF